ncbi:cytochrome P450 [Mycena rosella]|uniref:Cytochrome P450 n=1 Tax=Mycena rosella TaxID=1033263 RepID=A0AAD7G6G4_MYCRO|nr:cytochrome P450 [Mycena rosella]
MVWDKISTGSIAIVFATAGGRGRPPIWRGFSLLAAWPFFAQRNDFLWANLKKAGANIFRFRILQSREHHVVAMHGVDVRMAFFNATGLDMNEGYRPLMGGGAKVRDIDINAEETSRQFFLKHFRCCSRKTEWPKTDGSEGTMNPSNELNAIVLYFTVRMSSCQGLANDQKAVARMSELLDVMEKNSTPASLLLPWFPSPARRSRQGATRAELFAIMGAHFFLGLINAGYINTGMHVCWNLLYLGIHPDWKEKWPPKYKSSISNELDERLASIPLNGWETELPVLGCIIRETLRMTLGAGALRRNLGEEVVVGDRVIPQGDFLIYSLADVHADPDINPDPFKFDPARFDSGREEDKNVPSRSWDGTQASGAGPVDMCAPEYGWPNSNCQQLGEFLKSLPRADFNEFKWSGAAESAAQKRPSRYNPCYIKFNSIIA